MKPGLLNYLAYWEGRVNGAQVAEQFGISATQASEAFKAYKKTKFRTFNYPKAIAILCLAVFAVKATCYSLALQKIPHS